MVALVLVLNDSFPYVLSLGYSGEELARLSRTSQNKRFGNILSDPHIEQLWILALYVQ